MESNNVPDPPLVPPVIDEAELLGLPDDQRSMIEDELTEEPTLPLDTAEQQGLLLNDRIGSLPSQDGPSASVSARPGLKRDNSVPSPAPLHLPPPAPSGPSQPIPQSTDPLPLAQVQDLARTIPKFEPTPYAFAYDDASAFEDELEEWFTYSVEEQAMILKTQTAFTTEWSGFYASNTNGESIDWMKATTELQEEFVKDLTGALGLSDSTARLGKLEALTYFILGCWHESAGHSAPPTESEPKSQGGNITKSNYEKSGLQIALIRSNMELLVRCNGIPIIVDAMRSACLKTCGVDVDSDAHRDGKDAERREVWCAMTALYVVLEVARFQEKQNGDLSMRSIILETKKPSVFITLTELFSKLRWDESINLSLHKVCLLLWKTILVTFGGFAEVEKAKASFNKGKNLETEDARGQPIITASPLDYHTFRQEISSKYPAYNPPPPLFPLEPENNSILPPLKNHPNKVAGNDIFGSGLGNMNGNNTSIFQQPVHIATPAPSPPPSPAGPGGKGGKKQNYQTNQLFPFLYPPLDESSNKLGGKGSTDLQDLLVGRKWEGSDIPTSILEAAQLFAQRMRATRAMKQLWEARIHFMKYERGWSGVDEDIDIEALSLEPVQEEKEKQHYAPGSIEERMELVEESYRTGLPFLQSMVLVLIKAILTHVTTLVTQTSGPNGLQSGFQFQETQNGTSTHTNGVNGQNGSVSNNEELDAMRTQEILDKSVSGTLILLLKWLKVSHVLKFEYLAQLLVDSSYVPLILKLLQLQEIEKILNFKCEQGELNFFYFCRAHSRLGIEPEKPPTSPNNDTDTDSDDAAPPPIRMRRDGADETESDPIPLPQVVQPPEVDDLGFPTTEFPTEPITNFSWRAFFTSINYLRIMQKICKNKAHRNLMLVSYKSATFLRKALKVPQKELRLYTLKLFKNQVPYCGRKWRQTNMRVITAVYLTCRPELRDDWLAGSDVDAEVDESVPLEQALRALTHWYNLRRYPEGMGAKTGILEEEQDFFRRELEKMDWNDEGGDADGSGWDVQVEGWS